jgi:hypothetical protein
MVIGVDLTDRPEWSFAEKIAGTAWRAWAKLSVWRASVGGDGRSREITLERHADVRCVL